MWKDVKELGLHKWETLSGVNKPKAQWAIPSCTPATPALTKSKQTSVSPSVSGNAVACHICKMGFSDGSNFVGHIQAEHPQYKFFCEYPHYYRSFITRSGLYKHTKQVHPKEKANPDLDTEEFTVGCGLCFMEFNSEEACDAHDCVGKKKLNPSIKKESKVESDNGKNSNVNKMSTYSSLF